MINTRLLSGVLLSAILIVILQLQACAYAPQVKQLKQTQFQDLKVKATAELVDVPFFPQKKYQCGPAALATLLNYQNTQVTPDELVSKVYVPERHGSFQLEMIATTRQYDKLPYLLEPSLKDLLSEIDAGNPVLVLQNLAFDSYPQWHFAVVVGYDLNRSEIILRSATTKRWSTSLENFEQTWRKSNYWALLAVDADQPPVTARVSKWLQSAYDFEELNKHELAEKAYQAATEKWPSEAPVWLALSNLYYKQQRYQQALDLFNKVLPDFRQNAQMWNNYAYLLKAHQCDLEAYQAASCARQLAPNDRNVLATYGEMQQFDSRPSQGCSRVVCPL